MGILQMSQSTGSPSVKMLMFSGRSSSGAPLFSIKKMSIQLIEVQTHMHGTNNGTLDIQPSFGLNQYVKEVDN